MSDPKPNSMKPGKEARGSKLASRQKETAMNDEAISKLNIQNVSGLEMLQGKVTEENAASKNESKQKFVKPGKAARAAKVAERVNAPIEKDEVLANTTPELIKKDVPTNECGKSKADLRRERKAIQVILNIFSLIILHYKSKLNFQRKPNELKKQ